MSLVDYLDSALHSLFEGGSSKSAVDRLIKRADGARDQKDWPQAARDYQAAISAGCARPGVKVQLGHALKEMGDFDGAERQYREFLISHPDDADIHLQLGHLFNRKGDPSTALSFYEQAHRLAPEDADIARHVARIYAREDSVPEETTIIRIRSMFDAELDMPTDTGSTSQLS